MNILITTDWYAPIINGVVTSVLNLQKELEEKGHDVRILTLSQEGNEKKEGSVYYIKSFDISKFYPNARGTFSYHGKYVNEIIKWRPDVIHSQCELISFPFAKKIAKKCKCPIVHTYHTVYEDYTHYFTKNEKIGKKFVAFGTRFLLKNVDAVIAPTDKVKGLLEKYKVNNYIETIPTGIDLKKFNCQLDHLEKKQMKEDLGIDGTRKVLVSVGRLAKEKNVQEILQFVKEMKEEYPELLLLIVGDGPYKAALEKKAADAGLNQHVCFTGMVKPEEVHKYYQLGDIFVCGSSSETQGLTYIEALASGIPAVCKKDISIKEVIRNGSNGFTYETFEEFKQSIRRLLDDPQFYASVSENARLSTDKYSTWTFAEKVEYVYRSEIFMGGKEQMGRFQMFRKNTAS